MTDFKTRPPMNDAPAEMPGVEEEQIARIIRDAGIDEYAAASTILALFAPILAEKERALTEARSRLRWNIEDDGRLVRICEGLHERGEDCEFDTYVPEARALAAEAALAAERERAARIVEDWAEQHAAGLAEDGPSPLGRHRVAMNDGYALAAAIRAQGEG